MSYARPHPVCFGNLPDDLPVWIDSNVIDNDWVVVGGGSRSAKIRLDPDQLIDLSGYEVVEDLSKVFSSD